MALKKVTRVAAAVVHRDNTECVRLPHAASIFRAELYALLLAIDVVRRSKEKNFVIFSDSMSSLQSIIGFNLDSDLVQKFLKDYTDDCAKPTLFLVARSHNRYTSGLSHVLRCRAAQV